MNTGTVFKYLYGIFGVSPVFEHNESVSGLQVDGFDLSVSPEEVFAVFHGGMVRQISYVDLALTVRHFLKENEITIITVLLYYKDGVVMYYVTSSGFDKLIFKNVKNVCVT